MGRRMMVRVRRPGLSVSPRERAVRSGHCAGMIAAGVDVRLSCRCDMVRFLNFNRGVAGARLAGANTIESARRLLFQAGEGAGRQPRGSSAHDWVDSRSPSATTALTEHRKVSRFRGQMIGALASYARAITIGREDAVIVRAWHANRSWSTTLRLAGNGRKWIIVPVAWTPCTGAVRTLAAVEAPRIGRGRGGKSRELMPSRGMSRRRKHHGRQGNRAGTLQHNRGYLRLRYAVVDSLRW